MKNQLKTGIISALICWAVLAPDVVAAKTKNTMSAWGSVISGGVSAGLGIMKMNYFFEVGANVDALQLAAEGALLWAMKQATAKWKGISDQDEFTKAAKTNEADNKETPEVTTYPDPDFPFETESLTSVGLEAVFGVNTTTDSTQSDGTQNLANLARGRTIVMEKLTDIEGNGDTVSCKTDQDEVQKATVRMFKDVNYMWLSTAGIARAELGLKTAHQAAVDAGVADSTSGTVVDEKADNPVQMAADENFVGVKNYPSKATTAAGAMRIQSIMNLELAQRINLANALQSNLLTIEGARALRNGHPCGSDMPEGEE